MLETSPSSAVFTHYLSLVTLIAFGILVIITLYFFYCLITKKESTYFSFLSRWVLAKGFFITLFGMVMSLYYEYALYFPPCDLCWYQRIFMYSQVFIFGLAWLRNDRSILPYSLLLSSLGLVIAGYHQALQMGYSVYKPCSTAPFAVDCATPPFIEYGFVTFPLMAAVLFGFLVLFTASALFLKSSGKNI